MKILVVGGHAVEGFTTHIAETLRALGHQAAIYDYFLVSGRPGVPRAWKAAVERAVALGRKTEGGIAERLLRGLFRTVEADGPFDVVLSVHDFLQPLEVERLRRGGKTLTALWFPDPIGNMGREYFVAAPYDAIFLKEPYLVRRLRDRLGLPVFYLPECFNPARHCAGELTVADRSKFGCDVATAGSLYPYRAQMLRGLEGLDVRVWGARAPRWIGRWGLAQALRPEFVAYEQKAKAFLAAKVVVNTLRPSEVWGTNVRTFEIAGVGAYQLCEWTPGLPQLFEPGSEIDTFRTAAELAEMARRALADPERRARVAAAGKRRAHGEHTYSHRLRLLLGTLEGSAAGYPLPDVRPS